MSKLDKKHKIDYNRKWASENKEKVKEYRKTYRLKNKDKIKEYNSSYRSQNKELLKSKALEYYYKNKEKFRLYREENQGKWDVKSKVNSKELYRKYNLKKKYNITENDYNNFLKNQDNKCAICKTPDDVTASRKTLHVDHCHKTGKVRGLLCSQCNTSLGLLKDSIQSIENMLEYLKK